PHPPLLSLHRSGHHRALPSFPTRRSSDLREGARSELASAAATGPRGARSAPPNPEKQRSPDPAQRLPQHGSLKLDDFFASFADRSEEHTSELQSLRHLVCRLLLEKKKKKT